MTNEQILESLLDARNIISKLRTETQFTLPLADERLVRAWIHIDMRVRSAERAIWEEAGLIEVKNE